MIKCKKIISKLIMVSLLVGGTFVMNGGSVNALELSDINNHWGKVPIQKLVDMGGIKGYPDHTFKPDRSISNAEFISIVVGSVLKEQVNTTGTGDHWAKPSFDVAVAKGILKDGEIAKSNYDKPMSREDMAVVLTRVSEEVLKEAKVDGSTANKYIRDYSSLDSTHRDYVVQAFMKGLLNGKEESNFKPKDSLTRAEASTVVMRLLDPSLRVTPKEFSTTPVVKSHSNLEGLTKVNYPEEWDYTFLESFDKAYEISAADAKAKYDITKIDTNGGFGFKYRILINGEMIISDGYVKGNQYQEFGSVTMSKGGYQFIIADEKPDFDALVFHSQHNTIIVKGDPFI